MENAVALILSTFTSFLLTIPTISLAKKLHLVTDKRKRKHPAHTHTGIIPRAGGLPVYLSLLLVSLLLIPLNKIMIGILLGSFFLLIIGLLDDYSDMNPKLRFIANLLIAALVIGFGLGIPFVSNPFGGVVRLDTWKIPLQFLGKHSIWVYADLLAIIWLTWTTNMVNWSKGVDGQLPGFVAIAAIFLGLLSQRFVAHDINVQSVMLLSFIVAGAYIGFLPFNFYPQKIMPGYGGGALAGFLLGILSILSFGKVGAAIMILSMPLIDAAYTVLRRLKNNQSIFKADWGHLHHRLLEIGWGKRRIAVFYWLVTFILGISSLYFQKMEKVLAFGIIAVLLLVFIILTDEMKKNHAISK